MLLYFLIPRDVKSFGSMGRWLQQFFPSGTTITPSVVLVLVHQTVHPSIALRATWGFIPSFHS